MGLSAKEIPLHFCRLIQVSIEGSLTFSKRHPLISGVLLLLFILYLFLSYIYNFLVCLSPFLVCTAILVRIFWSSEQGQQNYVRSDEKKGEQRKIEKQFSKLPSIGKRDILLERRYSLRNATSRRRNFTDKKWDVQDIAVEEKDKELTVASNESENKDAKSSEKEEISSDCATSRWRNFEDKKWNAQDTVVEEKDKELSTVASNDSENKGAKSSEKEESSSDYAENFQNPDTQISPFESETSTSDLVKTSYSDQQNHRSDGCSGRSTLDNEEPADGDQEGEEGEESQEEESPEETNKAMEWSKDDQKNLMDLGISEIERNRRLESLIARRRARQQLKVQIEKGLIDIRTVSPSQIAPLLILKTNTFNSPKDYGEIDGLEIPGSAPSVLRPSRNPFDLPYDPSEEKPNLTEDSFQQEFTTNHQKDMPFCRHESFSFGLSSPFEDSYPFFINGRKISDRFRKLPGIQDKGNHDLIIEKLFSKDSDSGIGLSTGVKAPKPLLVKEETTNQEDIKSKTDIFNMRWKKISKFITDRKRESDFKNGILGYAETDHKISNGVSEKPEESRTHDKPDEKFLNFPVPSSTAAISESPFDSYSSPTSNNQESMFFSERGFFHRPTCSIASDLQVEISEVGSPTLTTDGESVAYDGDTDKEAVNTPRSEDFGGASFNSRVSEEDIAEASNNNSKIIASLVPLQQIDEEDDGADVSSFSSSDLLGDTPTHAKMNYDNNIFGPMKTAVVETHAPQPSSSSDFLIGRSVDLPPHQAQSEKPEERQNLPENSRTEAQVVDRHVNDAAVSNTQNSNSNEDPGPSIVHQGSNDAISENLFPFTPRSVLPEKTLTDQVSSSAFFNQQIRTDVPQLSIEAVAQATSTEELPPNAMPPNMQAFLIDAIAQTPGGASSNSQELVDPPENSMGKAEISGDAGQEKLKNGEYSEDKSTLIVRQDDSIKSPSSVQLRAMEDINNKSKEVADNEVTSSPSKETQQTNSSTATEDGKLAAELAQFTDVNPPEPDKPTSSTEIVSNVHSESKNNNGVISSKEEFKENLKNEKSDKPNDSSEEETSCPSTVKEKWNPYGVAQGTTDALITSGSSPVHLKLPEDNITSIIPGDKELADPPENDAVKCTKEDEEKLKNGENSKDKSTLLIRQDDAIKSPSSEMTTLDDKDNKSRKVDVNEVNCGPLKVNEKISNSTATEDAKMAAELAQFGDVNPPKPEKPNDSSEKVSDVLEEPKVVQDDMEKDKLANGNIALLHEVASSSFVEDTEGKFIEANENEAIERELNQEEAMASSRSVGKTEDSFTANTKEPGEAV